MNWLGELLSQGRSADDGDRKAEPAVALHSDPADVSSPSSESACERMVAHWLHKAHAARRGTDADWNVRSPAQRRAWAIEMLDAAERLDFYHPIWDEGDGGALWVWLESLERIANGDCEL